MPWFSGSQVFWLTWNQSTLFYRGCIIKFGTDALTRFFWYHSRLSLTKEVSMRAVAKRFMALLVSLIFVGVLT
ncbi:MAG: hypothetical protein MPJ22_11985, partial [Pirellulales bacterium]|nr:hypothetical protein [Pirellulales bacterium]